MAEAVALAPALLSPWGHAGPEWSLAWPSVVFNIPGGLLLSLMKDAAGVREQESIPALVAQVYLIQTLIISYLAFVWLRRKKLRAGAR